MDNKSEPSSLPRLSVQEDPESPVHPVYRIPIGATYAEFLSMLPGRDNASFEASLLDDHYFLNSYRSIHPEYLRDDILLPFYRHTESLSYYCLLGQKEWLERSLEPAVRILSKLEAGYTDLKHSGASRAALRTRYEYIRRPFNAYVRKRCALEKVMRDISASSIRELKREFKEEQQREVASRQSFSKRIPLPTRRDPE